MSTHSESVDVDAPRVEFEYATRTLFFKALNTAIERRLLPMVCAEINEFNMISFRKNNKFRVLFVLAVGFVDHWS